MLVLLHIRNENNFIYIIFKFCFQTGQPRFHYHKLRILLALNFWDHTPEVKVQMTLQVPITSRFYAFFNSIVCGFNISGQFYNIGPKLTMFSWHAYTQEIGGTRPQPGYSEYWTYALTTGAHALSRVLAEHNLKCTYIQM